MLNIYLYTARFLIVSGHTKEAMSYLCKALAEVNRTKEAEIVGHVLASMSYVRRIQQ